MVPRQEDAAATASSNMMMSDYGSIEAAVRNHQHRDGDEAVPLVPGGGSTGTNSGSSSNKFCGRQRSARTVAAAALVLLLVVGALSLLVVIQRDHPGSGGGSSSGIRYSQSPPPDHPPPREKNGEGVVAALGGSPVTLGVAATGRREDAAPSEIWGDLLAGGDGAGPPLPTNSWYLNLVSHRAAAAPDDSTSAYTVPYIVDTAVPRRSGAGAPNMAGGLRVHWPVRQAGDNNLQMVDDFKNSVSVGSADAALSASPSYRVDRGGPLSHLGVTLQWGGGGGDHPENSDGNSHSNSSSGPGNQTMTAHIVRGMPYATVQYAGGVLPVLYSYNGLASDIQVDGDGGGGDATTSELTCGVTGGHAGPTVPVQRELKIHFINSDFTWMVFFSKPVRVRCEMSEGDEKLRDFRLRVVEYEQGGDGDNNINNDDDDDSLTVRLALLDPCTTGQSDIQQHCAERADRKDDLGGYEQVLRENAHVLPTSPQIQFDYPNMSSSSSSEVNKESQEALMTIDWGARSTMASKDDNVEDDDDDNDNGDLLMFALPHHQDSLDPDMVTEHCINTFHGSTCLVKGKSWKLRESVGPPLSFTAPRPPEADAIPALADALATDIHYRLSSNLLRAAADTYFSGKFLARLGRVIVIAWELKQLAAAAGGASGDSLGGGGGLQALYSDDDDDVDQESLRASIEAAASAKLPSNQEITAALEQLKKGVQVWLSSKAEAPFLWDKSWGGLVNCGCRYVGEGEFGFCENKFPDCPALEDVNEDFGNGYYNDHHYHYGYHMYAAAVAAKFDPAWGIEHFDQILLYVRDFANPSNQDQFFPQFRNKDWYLGSSWASGIVSAENSPHGRNEESSSEAISAYEAVALFGSAMVDAFGSTKSDSDKLAAAELVRDSGQWLTATEIHATNRYWHVWSSDTHTNTYPKAYTKPVVGMLYDTMASFQTWFAPQAVVSYGIQLLPLTPVSERRDDPEWAAELYPLYEKSCQEAGDFCVENGWSILQAGLLATTGDRKTALKQALAIPTEVFASQGGGGNSLSNTIWYIATRKQIDASV